MDHTSALQEKHQLGQLTDSEVKEFFKLQAETFGNVRVRSRAYNELINAMYVFGPYLAHRPGLIPDFVKAVYNGGHAVFSGVVDKASFLEFLESKAQVDSNLSEALKKFGPQFEAAFDALENN